MPRRYRAWALLAPAGASAAADTFGHPHAPYYFRGRRTQAFEPNAGLMTVEALEALRAEKKRERRESGN